MRCVRSSRPPHFPVPIDSLPGKIRLHDLGNTDFELGSATVMSRLIPHVGNTLGFRVTVGGVSIAYLPDHQMPHDGSFSAVDNVFELIEGADLLIHDAQYTCDEFVVKRDWGHCTIDFALWLAKAAGVQRLALFHHDPVRHDDDLDLVEQHGAAFGDRHGFEVFAAAEGMSRLIERPG